MNKSINQNQGGGVSIYLNVDTTWHGKASCGGNHHHIISSTPSDNSGIGVPQHICWCCFIFHHHHQHQPFEAGTTMGVLAIDFWSLYAKGSTFHLQRVVG